MPNSSNMKGPNLRGPQAIIWVLFLAFCVYLFWVLDRVAGWELWPF